MTTVARPLAAASTAPAAGGQLTGTGSLVRFLLRRDRLKLPAWIGGITVFVLYLCTAVPVAYPTETLPEMTAMFTNPMGRMFVGPGYGFDDPSHARLIANGYSLYLMVLAALMSILAVVRHTRAEEQSGRSELIRSLAIGPYATLTAAVAVAALANAAVALTTTAVMIGIGGFAPTGSVIFGVSIAAVGLAFTGIAAITVQITEYSRAAAGLAGIVLGAAFVLRAVGDMLREGGSALSWLSPLGWGQQTAPFVLDRWWPLAPTLAVAVAGTATGYALAARRDIGAGLLAVRPGAPRARPALGTPLGLALRLQRSTIIGWMAALAVQGFVYGAFTDALLDASGDLPPAMADLFSGDRLVDGYLAYMAQFMAFLVAAYAVQSVQSLHSEEAAGRAAPVLATALTRPTWLGANLAVTAGAAVLITAVTGVATGLGAVLVTGDAAHLGTLTLAHLNQLPAALVVLGIAVLLFGWAPRAVPVAWVLVAYGVIAGTFGPVLKLPDRVLRLSPFEHAAALPVDTFAPAPLVVLTLVAVAAAGVGILGYRRRDVER